MSYFINYYIYYWLLEEGVDFDYDGLKEQFIKFLNDEERTSITLEKLVAEVSHKSYTEGSFHWNTVGKSMKSKLLPSLGCDEVSPVITPASKLSVSLYL